MIAYKVVEVVNDDDKERYYSCFLGNKGVEYGLQYETVSNLKDYPLFVFKKKSDAKKFKKDIESDWGAACQKYKMFKAECKENNNNSFSRMFINGWTYYPEGTIWADSVILLEEVK